jgi:DNA-binding transcriptional MerR regulator
MAKLKGDQMEPLVMINEAAKIIDRSPSMVRWYENEGILPAMRTSGGVRLFKKRDVEKLAEKLRTKKRAKGAEQAVVEVV